MLILIDRESLVPWAGAVECCGVRPSLARRAARAAQLAQKVVSHGGAWHEKAGLRQRTQAHSDVALSDSASFTALSDSASFTDFGRVFARIGQKRPTGGAAAAACAAAKVQAARRCAPAHARRAVGVRTTTLPTTERLFWHCGAHTAEPKLGPYGPLT